MSYLHFSCPFTLLANDSLVSLEKQKMGERGKLHTHKKFIRKREMERKKTPITLHGGVS